LETVADFFLWLKEAHGIKLTIFYDPLDRSRFLNGVWTTIHLSFVCVLASIAIGIAGAWLQMSPLVWVRRIMSGYIAFFRNTPPLVQLYFFYFAVDSALSGLFDIRGGILSSYGWAVIALSFFAGAFNTEIFRAGIEAVPGGQMEAARSLGMSYGKAMRFVIVPQAIRKVIPPLLNDYIALMKDTTLVSVIGLIEVVQAGRDIQSVEFNSSALMLGAILFVLVTIPLARVVDWMITRQQAQYERGSA